MRSMSDCSSGAAIGRGDNKRLRDEKAVGERLAKVDEELEETFEVQWDAVIPVRFTSVS